MKVSTTAAGLGAADRPSRTEESSHRRWVAVLFLGGLDVRARRDARRLRDLIREL
jgi:hypothetical protein